MLTHHFIDFVVVVIYVTIRYFIGFNESDRQCIDVAHNMITI